jgi:hypothetical protein
MRRLVAILFLCGSVFAVSPYAMSLSAGASAVHTPAASKKPSKPKAAYFVVSGTFLGHTIKGKASSNAVECNATDPYFDGIWHGTVGKTQQLSVDFHTNTAPTAPNPTTAGLVVNGDQQHRLSATNPVLTVGSDHRSGSFDAQFADSANPSNQLSVNGPFKCSSSS